MLLFICYPKCTTCQRAKAWLDAHNIPYTLRNIKEENPTLPELVAWQAQSGLPLRRFFNTSGLSYKALGLKENLPSLSVQEQLNLLAADGMLVKRPLLIGADFTLVGFREEAWAKRLL